jgi:hypothetical protein
VLHLLPTGSAGDQVAEPFEAAVAWMLGVMATVGVVEPLEDKAGGVAAADALAGEEACDGLEKLTHHCKFHYRYFSSSGDEELC